jgi:hypothetical protein
MRSHHFRALTLTFALVLLAVAAPVASASAAQATQITTPTGLSYPFIQEGGRIPIAGTATGLAVPDLEIRCYYGAEPGSYRVVASKVPVADDAFSVEASTFELPNALCQLRAVPETSPVPTKPALPPGEDERFEGPLVVASEFVPETSNYYAASSTLTGTFFLGGYALESFLYSASGHDNPQLFYGAANLSASVADETRSSVEVDGYDAYLPKAAREVEEDFKKEAERKNNELFTPPAGKPAVAVEDHFDEATRQMTIEERDPVVKCWPEPATYPPTPTSCTSFVATGVEVQRTWQTSDEDHVAALTETWSSSDGAAHTVSVRYFDEMASAKGGGAYEFPGEASFAPTREGEVTTLPAGPRAILYKTAEKLTEIGDDEHPQGAIVYDTAPSEAIQITSGSRNGTYNSFEAPYLLTIPASGSSAPVRMTFIQAFALTEVDALVAPAIAGYEPSPPSSPPAMPATPSAAPAPVTASLDGPAGSAKGHVSLKLACHGAAGTSCRIHVSLTTVEKSRGGHLIALAATRTRSKQVTLAADTVVIPAGHQLEVTLTLNATGRKLLARFGKLPARLTAVLEVAGARHTVFARNLTIEPKRRRHSH